MSEPRLVIARHGNTFDRGETVRRVGGRTDLALSRSGQVQARELADHFAASELRFERAYCSELKRTLGTLAPILERGMHPARGPVLRPFLREIDYGVDENKPEADVVARLGEAALRAWDTQAVLPPGWQLDVDALVASWRGFLAEQRYLGGTAIVMTSNGVARFVFDALDTPKGAHDIKLRTGAYGELVATAEGWRIARWNIRPDQGAGSKSPTP